MAQTKKAYDEVRIPFTKMTFSPDVPSSALGPNEYNAGLNVETDVRGIRSVAGDETILPDVPGTPTFVTGGFRPPQEGKDNDFYFIVATDEGYWYASNGLGAWQDITPGAGPFTTYNQATNITEAWNGTIPFFNDEANPPMFWPAFEGVSLATTGASSSAGVSTITFPTYTSSITGASIVGTAGQFNYTGNQPLKLNQKVYVSGTLTGTGTITGYSNPTTYYIVSTNGFDSFTLSTTLGGSGVVTTAGSVDGLSFAYSPFAIGQEILVEQIVPTSYRGLHTVTDVSLSDVSFSLTTTGTQIVSGAVSDPYPQMIMYSNVIPGSIDNIAYVSPAVQQITLSTPYETAPYQAGDKIVISDVDNYYNGTFTVVSSTTSTIDYYAVPGAAYPGGGSVAPLYSWNDNPFYKSVVAKFMRIYNTPNVGCVLVAGGLTAVQLDGTIKESSTSIRWSQEFGLNQAPTTWQPTVTNVANTVNTPLRAGAVDAFPSNGQMFVCSYWDTVVLSPMNYATTNTPSLGVRLVNQGRGLLSSNCWANTDKLVYGIDARDIWVFNGQDFQGLGNQRVKNWFYDQLDPDYVDRVFMQTNTQKNQVEIYYPTVPPIISDITVLDTAGTFGCTLESGVLRNGLSVVLSGTESGTGSISGYSNPTTYYVVDTNGVDEFTLSTTPTGNGVTTTVGTVTGLNFKFVSDGVPNMMLSYRYDLDCFNAPREVQSATMATESPAWNSLEWYYNLTGTNISSSGSGAHYNILRTNEAYQGYPTNNVRGTGYAVGDTIKITGDLLGGTTPTNDATVTVTAVDTGGKISTFTVTGTPLDTWRYNAGDRNVVYARGLTNRTLVQQDDGYNFLGPQLREYPIRSYFRRDNIKMIEDYSGKLMVHRILPEINNLSKVGVPIMPATSPENIGSVDITIEGANSVGQDPVASVAHTLATDTNNPWVQINQNAFRVNSIEIGNSATKNIWICSATTWQFTQVEDDR